MAKKHFLLPSSLVKKNPVLNQPGWLLEALFIRTMVSFLRLFTPERGEKITRGFFTLIRPILPFMDKINANLKIAFPEISDSECKHLANKIAANLGSTVAELIFAEKIWLQRADRIEYVVDDRVDLARYQNNPVVMVTGHIGAWQIAPFVAKAHQLKVTSVFAPEENPYIGDFMFALRETMQSNWVSRDGCMKHLVRELKNGNAVGLVADTKMDDGEPVPFFGSDMQVNTAAARLAIRHQCDFLPIRAERLPGMRFRITVGPCIESENTNLPVNEQAVEMTGKMIAVFESWIRDKPAEWMCFSRRWPRDLYR